jgi:hypothetical protein
VCDLRNISKSVISTEASHRFTVRGAVEKSAFLSNMTVPGEQQIPPLRYGRNDTLKKDGYSMTSLIDSPMAKPHLLYQNCD